MKIDFPLSLEIYDEEKILQALEDFSEVCSVEFYAWKLSFSWENESEIQENFREFMNYVLSL